MMRILVIGAGALGGYFGARLLAAGRDVTFLVRPKRAEALAKNGLSVKSVFGDLYLPSPPTITADKLGQPFDLIILSCKAYDLDGAIESFAPAVGDNTVIIPLLNGMRHIEILNERFGKRRVFGGQCVISATLSAEGTVVHVNDLHTLTFGAQTGASDDHGAILAALSDANFAAEASTNIIQEMWEKWVFIATAAGSTCLMRASIGDIASAGGSNLVIRMLGECAHVAAREGFEPRPTHMQRIRSILTTPGLPLMASMLRDIERGARTEGHHVLGDLLRRNGEDATAPLLQAAYIHVKSYEARQAREANAG
jgi:2-dehydropantoate 2-reductase